MMYEQLRNRESDGAQANQIPSGVQQSFIALILAPGNQGKKKSATDDQALKTQRKGSEHYGKKSKNT